MLDSGEDAGLNWLEYQEKVRVDAERVAAADERAQILTELSSLRNKVTFLTKRNLKAFARVLEIFP